MRRWTYFPELDEVRQRRYADEHAVGKCVAEEEQEELVIGEANAVIDPWAMVCNE